MEIPLIDLAQQDSPASLAKAVADAAESIGFLYLKNTGLETQAAEVFKVSKDFFLNESAEEKEAVSMTTNNVGYSKPGQESLDPSKPGDQKQVFNFALCAPDGTPQQPLPPRLKESKDAIFQLQKQCHAFCQRLLEAFAIGINMPSDYFTNQHLYTVPENISALRLLHYPAPTSKANEASHRAGAHSDYGSLTLLFQQAVDGGDGLQVLPPSCSIDDESAWINVPVVENAVLVNIGDAFEFWSSCRYKSTLHRVISPPYKEGVKGHDRFSMAFFCQPNKDAVLKAVVPPREVSAEDIKRLERKGCSFGSTPTSLQHLQMRLNSTYTGRREVEG